MSDVFRTVTFCIFFAVVIAQLILTAFFVDKKNVWSVPEEDKVIMLLNCAKIFYTKVSEKIAYANNVDSDQTAPEGASASTLPPGLHF